MWLTEVIIDGFKSYAAREVVSGFDMSFNAITGLNGTGKSNILDAICFVLGITNLTQVSYNFMHLPGPYSTYSIFSHQMSIQFLQVRVSNLQQLVYKQGQAGVTKASVTLVFNNEDKERSPIGYQQFNTITITRQVRTLSATKGSSQCLPSVPSEQGGDRWPQQVLDQRA